MGTPDIKNTNNIPKLFDVSTDLLVKFREEISANDIQERISLGEYHTEGKFKSKPETDVKSKCPDAESILLLVRKENLNFVEKAVDFMEMFVASHTVDSPNELTSYC